MCCARVGLDCETCVRKSAERVLALCSHLSEDQQKGVFFHLYPDPICRTNLKRFRRQYEQLRVDPPADSGVEPVLELAIA